MTISTLRAAAGADRCVAAAFVLLLPLCMACSGTDAERKQRFLESGRQAAAANRDGEAVIAYRNAVQIDPMFAEARVALAQALARQGDSLASLSEYVRAADLRRDDLDLQIKTGNLLMAVGNVSDARHRAEQVLAKSPQHVEAHILLGNALGGLQSLDQALDQMEEAIKLDPARAASHIQIAIVKQAMGDPAEAEAAFKRAVALSPRWAGAHVALSHFYITSGQAREAHAAIDTALAIEPLHPGANRVKAVLSMATGRPRDAAEPFQRLAEISASSESRFALVDYFLVVGDVDKAIEELTTLAGDRRTAAQAKLRLIRALAMEGETSRAWELIAALLAENPRNHAARMFESQLLLDAGRAVEALASAKLAVEGDAKSSGAHYTLGKAYAAVGDAVGAEEAFRQVLRINPRATPAQVELSLLLLGNRPSDSVQVASAAVRGRPRDLAARIALVRSLIAVGDLRQAEQQLAEAQKRQPSAAGHVQSGVLASLRKDIAAARRAFDTALQLQPESIEALAGHLSVDLQLSDFDAARARLQRRLAGQVSTEVLLLAARTYMSMNDLNAAESVLRRAVEASPESLPPYSLLGQLYIKQNKLDQARAEFDRLATKQARPVGAWTMSGTILQVLGDNQGARQRYERALSLDPGAPVAANNLAWIYAESGESPDQAIDLSQRALQRLPEQPEVLDTLGFAYLKGNQPAMAVRTLTRCVKAAPSNAGCRYHLGLAQASAGDETAARASYRIVLSLPNKGQFVKLAQQALDSLGPPSPGR